MNILILMGSPRLHGNTAELCKPLIDELRLGGADIHYIELSELDIRPCKGCYACQNVSGQYGCVQQDDILSSSVSYMSRI